MRFISFTTSDNQTPNLGLLRDDATVDDFGIETGDALIQILGRGKADVEGLEWYLQQYANRLPLSDVQMQAPLPRPSGLRDFYAFEAHVQAVHALRGQDVPSVWYDMPIFCYANHRSVFGPEDAIPYPAQTQALDYELKVACVIAREGRDIPVEQALDYVMGFTIFNDWSARDLQAQEMSVGLGPARCKDFANSFGPYLVTPDELAGQSTGRPGVYDLAMLARVNGEERSRGNWKDLYHSFGEMIAHASVGVTLYPGDIIGSGTVGTGCLLEITQGAGPWLQPGDVVELEVERLGVLRNTVVTL